MNEIEAGKNYRAKRVRGGTSSKGQWELIAVTDKVDKNEITIFTRNHPCGVKDGDQFNIEQIHNIKYGFKKNNNDRWVPQVTIECTVHPIKSEFDEMGVEGAADDPWKDIGNDDEFELPY